MQFVFNPNYVLLIVGFILGLYHIVTNGSDLKRSKSLSESRSSSERNVKGIMQELIRGIKEEIGKAAVDNSTETILTMCICILLFFMTEFLFFFNTIMALVILGVLKTSIGTIPLAAKPLISLIFKENEITEEINKLLNEENPITPIIIILALIRMKVFVKYITLANSFKNMVVTEISFEEKIKLIKTVATEIGLDKVEGYETVIEEIEKFTDDKKDDAILKLQNIAIQYATLLLSGNSDSITDTIINRLKEIVNPSNQEGDK